MATTTTFEAIRDGFYADVEALTPTVLARSEYVFRRLPDRRIAVRVWAAQQSTDSCLRRFDMRITGDVEEFPVIHHDAREVNVQATFTIAYPVLPGVYGEQDLDDMEDVVESDTRQIYDVLRSASNWPAGMSNCQVTISTTDRDSVQDVWFKDFQCLLTYTAAATIGA